MCVAGTSAADVKTTLMNSAIPSLDSQFAGATAPANAQGAGLINIYNAVTALISVTPNKLLLRKCLCHGSFPQQWATHFSGWRSTAGAAAPMDVLLFKRCFA